MDVQIARKNNTFSSLAAHDVLTAMSAKSVLGDVIEVKPLSSLNNASVCVTTSKAKYFFRMVAKSTDQFKIPAADERRTEQQNPELSPAAVAPNKA